MACGEVGYVWLSWHKDNAEERQRAIDPCIQECCRYEEVRRDSYDRVPGEGIESQWTGGKSDQDLEGSVSHDAALHRAPVQEEDREELCAEQLVDLMGLGGAEPVQGPFQWTDFFRDDDRASMQTQGGSFRRESAFPAYEEWERRISEGYRDIYWDDGPKQYLLDWQQ